MNTREMFEDWYKDQLQCIESTKDELEYYKGIGGLQACLAIGMIAEYEYDDLKKMFWEAWRK